MSTAEGLDRPNSEVIIDVSGMRHLYHRPRLVDYISQIWRARTLAITEARAGVLLKNRRSYLGDVWLILNPLLNGLVYFFVFGVVLQVGSRVENYLGFLLVGVFFYQMTSGSLSQSADSIFTQRKLITSLSLPVCMGPIVIVLRRWIDGLPSYLVMILLVLIIPPVETVSWKALLILPLVFLQFIMSLGLAFIGAYSVSRVHDIIHLISIGLKGLMFASGVMFPVDDISSVHPAIGQIIHWNPVHHMLEIVRSAFLYDSLPPTESWLILGIWAAGSLLVGILLIWQREGKYDLNEN